MRATGVLGFAAGAALGVAIATLLGATTCFAGGLLVIIRTFGVLAGTLGAALTLGIDGGLGGCATLPRSVRGVVDLASVAGVTAGRAAGLAGGKLWITTPGIALSTGGVAAALGEAGGAGRTGTRGAGGARLPSGRTITVRTLRGASGAVVAFLAGCDVGALGG